MPPVRQSEAKGITNKKGGRRAKRDARPQGDMIPATFYDLLTQGRWKQNSCKYLLVTFFCYIFANMKKRKEKFADLLLDIVKYVFTAGLLAVWFADISQWKWYSYVLLLCGVALVVTFALLLYDNDDKK